jgi:hypothetical protein
MRQGIDKGHLFEMPQGKSPILFMIEAYPAASCSPASAGFTGRNSIHFLIRSLTPQQDFDEFSRVAAGDALAVAVQSST